MTSTTNANVAWARHILEIYKKEIILANANTNTIQPSVRQDVVSNKFLKFAKNAATNEKFKWIWKRQRYGGRKQSRYAARGCFYLHLLSHRGTRLNSICVWHSQYRIGIVINSRINFSVDTIFVSLCESYRRGVSLTLRIYARVVEAVSVSALVSEALSLSLATVVFGWGYSLSSQWKNPGLFSVKKWHLAFRGGRVRPRAFVYAGLAVEILVRTIRYPRKTMRWYFLKFPPLRFSLDEWCRDYDRADESEFDFHMGTPYSHDIWVAYEKILTSAVP